MANTRLGTAEVVVTMDDTQVRGQVNRLEAALEAGFLRSLSRFGQIGTIAAAALIPLVEQAAALGSALASAASAGATAAPLLTSLGQAGAVLAVGFQGLGDALEDGGDALAALPPQTEAAITAIRELDGEWQSLTQAVQEELFAGVADNINLLANTYLPSLQNRLVDTATEINRFGDAFTEWATARETVLSLNQIMDAQSGILDDLLDSVIPVGDGLITIFQDTIPFAEDLAQAIERNAVRFQEWANQVSASGAVTEFFERATNNAQLLLGILGNLTQGIGAFFSAGTAGGTELLAQIERITEDFANFANSAQGQEQFATLFQNASTYASQFADVVSALGSILASVFEIVAAGGGVFLDLLSTIAGPLADGVGVLADAFTALPGPIAEFTAALLLIRRFGQFNTFATMATSLRGFRDEVERTSASSYASTGGFYGMGRAMSTATVLARTLQGALTGLWPIAAIGILITAFTAVKQSIDDASVSAEEAQSVVASLSAGLDAEDLVGPWSDYQEALREARDAAKDAQVGIDLLGDSTGVWGQQSAFATLASQNLESALANQENAAAQLRDSFEEVDIALSDLAAGGDIVAFGNAVRQMGEQFGLSGNELEEFVTNVLPQTEQAFRDAEQGLLGFANQTDVSVDEFERMQEALGLTDSELRRLAEEGGPAYVEALARINEAQRLGIDSTGEIDAELVRLAEQLNVAGEGAQEFAAETVSAWQDIVQGLNPLGTAVENTLAASEEAASQFAESFAEAFELDTSDVESALAAGEQAFLAFATENGINAETASQAWADYAADSAFSIDTFIQELQNQVLASQNFVNNMAIAAQLGGQEFAQELAAQGGPQALQGFVDANDSQQQAIIDSINQLMTIGTQGAAEALALGLSELPGLAGQAGVDTFTNLIQGISNPEEMQAIVDQLNSVASLGFNNMAQAANIYGAATANNLFLNLQNGVALSAEQIQLLQLGSEQGLINWAVIAATQGSTFANNLKSAVANGRQLTAQETAILIANSNTNMSTWAAIASSKGAEWVTNLAGQLARGEITFDQYIAEIEAAAAAADADVETQVIKPPPGQVSGIYQGIENALATPVGVGTVLRQPNISSWFAGLNIPTVTIPTQLGQPGYGVLANAAGGIYDRPAFTTIGEAYQKEVIIPLERPQRAQQLAELSGLFDVVSDPRFRQSSNNAFGDLRVDIGDVVINALAMEDIALQEATLQESIDFATLQFQELIILLLNLITRFGQLDLATVNLMTQIGTFRARLVPLDLVYSQLRLMTIDTMKYIGVFRARLINLSASLNNLLTSVNALDILVDNYQLPSTGQQLSGIEQAAQELLEHIQAGGSFYEDFTFGGNSELLSNFNDQLADLFYSANPGFDFGPSGTSQAIIDWLQEFLGRAVNRADLSFNLTRADAQPQRVIQIAEGAIVVNTQIADPAEVAEQVMDRFASLGA